MSDGDGFGMQDLDRTLTRHDTAFAAEVAQNARRDLAPSRRRPRRGGVPEASPTSFIRASQRRSIVGDASADRPGRAKPTIYGRPSIELRWVTRDGCASRAPGSKPNPTIPPSTTSGLARSSPQAVQAYRYSVHAGRFDATDRTLMASSRSSSNSTWLERVADDKGSPARAWSQSCSAEKVKSIAARDGPQRPCAAGRVGGAERQTGAAPEVRLVPS